MNTGCIAVDHAGHAQSGEWPVVICCVVPGDFAGVGGYVSASRARSKLISLHVGETRAPGGAGVKVENYQIDASGLVVPY